MNRRRTAFLTFLPLISLAIGLAACEDDDPTGAGNGVPAALNPAAVEAHLRSVLPAAAAGLTDGVERLLMAATGGAVDGVVLIPVGNVVQAQVGVDLDGDGTRETTFSGSAIFSDESLDLGQGVTLTVDGVSDPNQPTADLSGSTNMSQIGPTTVYFSGTSGHLGVGEPGSSDAYDIYVSSGELSLEVLSGSPSGYAGGSIGAEEEYVDWSAYVEPTTGGGWEVVIYGEEFEFTVP